MPASASVIERNLIVSSLSRKNEISFLDSCELISLIPFKILNETGKSVSYIYFPISGFISLIVQIDGNLDIEVGIVGFEGMLGLNVALGVKYSLLHSMVQGEGKALRISTANFLRYLKEDITMQQKMQTYSYARMNQLALSISCNHSHRINARLATWIMIARDCMRSDTFHITHEFLSYMLGVRRVSITQSAIAMQKKNLISYNRGVLTIVDPKMLEVESCGCYYRNKEIYTKIMGIKI